MKFVDLNNEIVERAINGDHDAQMKLLQRYDKYINKVSTKIVVDKHGFSHKYIDADFKAEVQMRYLKELSKCKVVKTK